MQLKTLCSILLFISLNFSVEAAVYSIQDTIRAEVFLKMIPMQSSRLDQFDLISFESQMFRENDYIVYQSKGKRTKQKGKIIRFKNGEMWVHNLNTDKIDKVKIEDINTMRKQYNFWSFVSLFTSLLGIYFLLTTAILLFIFLIFLAINNSSSSGSPGSTPLFSNTIIISVYAFFIAMIGLSLSRSGLKSLLPFRKYRIGKKYHAKLYEIKPTE
jgi:hypothetical protein